jgi:hypothetical protein
VEYEGGLGGEREGDGKGERRKISDNVTRRGRRKERKGYEREI